MSIHTNFFPDGITVNSASDFIAPWLAAFSDGVFAAADFSVSADSPADLAVTVAAGHAMKSGHFVISDSAISVAIGSNTSGYNRYDLIVLEVDDTNTVTAVKAVQGVPSSSPVAPVASSIQLPLALVLVGNNVSVINTNVIMDMRYPVLSVGSYPGKGEPFYGQISAVPWNRIVADGSAVSRTRYARLFAAMGTQWGAGDGSTTFNLPDGRGATFAGYQSGDDTFGTLGAKAGSKTQSFGLGSGSACISADGAYLRITRKNVSMLGDVKASINFTGASEADQWSAALQGSTDSGSIVQPTNVGLWLIAW